MLRAVHSTFSSPDAVARLQLYKNNRSFRLFLYNARVTGLEPATSPVTGERSNQLSYTRIFEFYLNNNHLLSLGLSSQNDYTRMVSDDLSIKRSKNHCVGGGNRSLQNQYPCLDTFFAEGSNLSQTSFDSYPTQARLSLVRHVSGVGIEPTTPGL